MKRLFSALALSMLLALSGSQMCYAAERKNVVTEFPQEISVEGGILKFVGMSEDTARGVARAQFRVYTHGDNLNVRSGPGTNYSIIGSFANGSLIEIPDPYSSAEWVYATGTDVYSGKTISGYIYSAYYI